MLLGDVEFRRKTKSGLLRHPSYKGLREDLMELPQTPRRSSASKRGSNGRPNKEKVKTGQQGTNEPWKRPDLSSQNPSQPAPHPRPREPKDNETA